MPDQPSDAELAARAAVKAEAVTEHTQHTTAEASVSRIVAAVMSAAHSEFDPPMGPVIEASDVAAILGTLHDGHGVYASDIILARKAKGLQTVLTLRDEGMAIDAILHVIETAGSAWGT
jgi:hypothetical protein